MIIENKYLPKSEFQSLLDQLVNLGYEVVGPCVDQGAIVFDQIHSVQQLPIGWTDEQAPGSYRLKRRDDDAMFAYNVGPHSWKKYLFPPLLRLMRSRKTNDGWRLSDEPVEEKKYAMLGVRACELAAIAIQDRVFLSHEYVDPVYKQHRESTFIVAVNCTQAAATCFCTSMNTGPKCTAGFDLALTEVPDGFVVLSGSAAGEKLVDSLALRPAAVEQVKQAEAARQNAVDQISKHMDTEDIHQRLLAQLDHPHWQSVAERCLSCANCTLVCPTCFCTSVDEVHDLTNQEVIRQRRWDSCFNFDFSHVAGGSVRDSVRSRYRQWLTHKLATWMDQFDTSGCVGCGRCITWCPVGIDLTKEVAMLCDDDTARQQLPSTAR